ncbi:FAD-binding oxidoreductase [Gulosibacter sp. 10]|uniref:FAD-binding oxidoreductase n=1 Tax=Gulosibacter sp. 10 TaxID=1255570 RepID=UPI00097F3CD3|nr:FAD-linked oxidase C-terminal domain-containing protein [Gulosibacter sp. 10]SJM64424.1 Glycolate dehydrogenase, subunit GlcD [Gulosibacter sp. 10]
MTNISELRAALGDRLLEDPLEVLPYTTDESRAALAAPPSAVVLAERTEDVVRALEWANRWEVPVSVRGAGTGLAGGAVAYPEGLVVSLERMNRILSIDPVNRLIEVEAGVITAAIDAAAAEHGLMYAPDPASYRESTIGGNIATNAGGLRCVRYGVTLDAVSGLEVVLGSGELLRTGTQTRKDVVGFNLTELLVGSEGTLGVVTRATLRLVPRPEGPMATFRAFFPDLASAGRTVSALAMRTGLTPEVLELLDRPSLAAVARTVPGLGRIPDAAALLIGQFAGERAAEDGDRAVGIALEHGASEVDTDVVDDLLEARRGTGRALSAAGLRVSSDVAVPVSRLAEMFAAIERISAEEGVTIPTFAHAGDGNLHPSVLVTTGDEAERAHAEAVLDRVGAAALSFGGTLSGEHGIGSLKHHALDTQLEGVSRTVMRGIKRVFDPRGILSPGRAI